MKQDYWFKRKRYGWGWTPCSREGWIVTWIAIGLTIFIGLKYSTTQYFIPSIIAIVLVLLIIAKRTGEPPRWSWGK